MASPTGIGLESVDGGDGGVGKTLLAFAMKCSLHKICQQFLFRDSIYSPLAFRLLPLGPARPPQPPAATGCVRCGVERHVRLTMSGKCSELIARGELRAALSGQKRKKLRCNQLVSTAINN